MQSPVFSFYLDRYVRLKQSTEGCKLNVVKMWKACKEFFTRWFCRDENKQIGGELALGGADSVHYKPPVRYVPVSVPGYWQFDMEG